MAKEWAERLAKTEKMEHGDVKNLGENIYCKTSSQPWFEMSGSEVVDNWYNEVEEHNYDEEPSQGYLKRGHFTQLVWKDTKELGVAFARNKNGHMAYVVAYFDPKGNWIGEFKEQVLPPVGAAVKKKKRRRRTRTNERTSSGSSKASSRTADSKTRNSTDTPDSQSTGTPQSATDSATREDPYDRNGKSDSAKRDPRTAFGTPDDNSSEKGTRKLRNAAGGVIAFSPLLMDFADEDFYDDCLKAHNYYRENHGVQPLRLSEELCEYAQEWANKIAGQDMMDHRMENDYGENIYMKWSRDPRYKIPGEEAVDSWYEESKDFTYGTEPLDLSAGHFTQMIWADSEELGVGVAKSKTGKIYVVANYDPPGNYLGQFSEMVPPLLEQ
ncbi:UNVERIFIED_CONTAM: hypothetical protein RMT77_019648 [Armadillidium vulgare]